MTDFGMDWDAIERHHKKMEDEFKKLFLDTSVRVPAVGDTVIVAAGLLGMGHLWIREEAKVLEVGDTSVKVQFLHYQRFGGEEVAMWIHPALVTDVIQKQEKE